MANATWVHVNQVRRYKAGTTWPSLDAIKKTAVTIDMLVFDEEELAPDEKLVVKELLERMTIKYQTRRWDASRQTAAKG